MSAIISLHIGGCGINLGSDFWADLSDQHGIQNGRYKGQNQEEELAQINSFFQEHSNKKYTSRAILVDLEESFDYSQYKDLFDQSNVICQGYGSAEKNYARGYLAEGRDVADKALGQIRKEAERADNLNGFQITHGIGGGSGSGMAAYLMEQIANNYKDPVISSFTIFHSDKVTDSGGSLYDIQTHAYNSVLALKTLIAESQFTVCLSNDNFYNHLSKIYKEVLMQDVNELFTQVMSDSTAPLRFPDMLHSNLRKLSRAMVPFPSLHFLSASTYPLDMGNDKIKEEDIANKLFDPSNNLNYFNGDSDKVLASYSTFRGIDSPSHMIYRIKKLSQKNSLGKGNFPSFYNVSGSGATGSLMANTTGIAGMIESVSRQFRSLYKKKGFVHYYTKESMETSDFDDAIKEVEELLEAYKYRKSELKEDLHSMFTARDRAHIHTKFKGQNQS